MRWTFYQQQKLNSNFDVIIVGSGISSLVTAAILAKAGQKVLMLEKHYEIGGFTHTFKRRGYEWNTGLHYIGQVHNPEATLRQIFDYVSDYKLNWSHMGEIYDRFFFPDRSYCYYSDPQKFQSSLCVDFPEEQEAIDQYIKDITTGSSCRSTFFLQKIIPGPLAILTRPFLTRKFGKLSKKTTYEHLRKLTNNEKLISVLTGQWGNYGLPPKKSSFGIHALVASHYIGGGSYPVGGCRKIAESIVATIEKNQGQVFAKAGVQKIITKGNQAIGVRLENGDEIFAKKIISGAGALNTFRMVDHSFDIEKKLKGVTPSNSYMDLFIGLKGDPQALGLPKSNYWIFPSYDHAKNVDNYLNDYTQDFPVVYISFPSTKDPQWNERYPGKSTIEIITLAPYDWFKKWEEKPWRKRGKEYDDFKEQFCERLFTKLFEHFPQLKDKVDYYELSSPLSIRHFTNYHQGEMYGLDHTPERFTLKWLRPQTPVKNLFMTGQDIVSDGVAGATFSGILTTCTVMRKNMIKHIEQDIAKENKHE
ncbi:phytoene desaturase family protein [Candidatus Uabimicrobium sp. HlEnr_7]|uniref:phytoene desaturase family protein n=1 Tax=Candidatus Uabimicrobium helgolandensis TaxID=3095367 RepID=UPI003557F277